jgi:cell division ATPase FtsA
MGIFSKHDKKDELTLVINFGSSSVAAALFFVQESGIPKIIFSARESIAVEKEINAERFLLLAIQALEKAINKVHDAKLGVPSRVFCVLASHWCVYQTRVINYKKNTPFLFTEKLADGLIQKEIKLFEEEHLIKYGSANNSIRTIELKNIKIALNGYETASPLEKSARELEMTIFLSLGEERILQKIENVVKKYFHFERMRFSSFALSSFTIARDLHSEEKDFLLVDIGGEITDIFMVKKGLLLESMSFPLGRNFLTRGVSSQLGCSLGEADSLISLFKDGHAEEATAQKLNLIMNKLRKEWLNKFQESLINLSVDISIPSVIYTIIDKDLADFFSETIKTEQFSQYTLTESKFKVNLLGSESLHGLATFEEKVVREPFLIIDAIYINRFLTTS